MNKITQIVRYKQGGLVWIGDVSHNSWQYFKGVGANNYVDFFSECRLYAITSPNINIDGSEKRNVVDDLILYLIDNNNKFIIGNSNETREFTLNGLVRRVKYSNILNEKNEVYQMNNIDLSFSVDPEVIRFVEDTNPADLEIVNIRDDETIYAFQTQPGPSKHDVHACHVLYVVMSNDRKKMFQL